MKSLPDDVKTFLKIMSEKHPSPNQIGDVVRILKKMKVFLTHEDLGEKTALILTQVHFNLSLIHFTDALIRNEILIDNALQCLVSMTRIQPTGQQVLITSLLSGQLVTHHLHIIALIHFNFFLRPE